MSNINDTIHGIAQGDSRCVIGSDEGGEMYKSRNITNDHKPDNPEEKLRIEQWGGFVSPPPEPGIRLNLNSSLV